jgi:hypothetical protein
MIWPVPKLKTKTVAAPKKRKTRKKEPESQFVMPAGSPTNFAANTPLMENQPAE